MAKITNFNKTQIEPKEAVSDNTPLEVTEKKEIPKATYTIQPPRFQPKPQLTPEQEYEAVLKEIETAKANGQNKVIIKRDLRDLAWQKLSQAGYKLQRKVMDRLGDYDAANIEDKDQNRVEFEISLTEFNQAYFIK